MVEENATPPTEPGGDEPRRRGGLFGGRRTGRRAQVVPRYPDDAPVREEAAPAEQASTAAESASVEARNSAVSCVISQ